MPGRCRSDLQGFLIHNYYVHHTGNLYCFSISFGSSVSPVLSFLATFVPFIYLGCLFFPSNKFVVVFLPASAYGQNAFSGMEFP